MQDYATKTHRNKLTTICVDVG